MGWKSDCGNHQGKALWSANGVELKLESGTTSRKDLRSPPASIYTVRIRNRLNFAEPDDQLSIPGPSSIVVNSFAVCSIIGSFRMDHEGISINPSATVQDTRVDHGMSKFWSYLQAMKPFVPVVPAGQFEWVETDRFLRIANARWTMLSPALRAENMVVMVKNPWTISNVVS